MFNLVNCFDPDDGQWNFVWLFCGISGLIELAPVIPISGLRGVM